MKQELKKTHDDTVADQADMKKRYEDSYQELKLMLEKREIQQIIRKAQKKENSTTSLDDLKPEGNRSS